MNKYIAVGAELLKSWDKSIVNIKEKKELGKYIGGSICIIFIFGAIFGAILGLFAGSVQIVIDAVKIPVLFIVSGIIALPVYYVMDALTGGKKELGQIAALLFSATALTTIILVGFVPILLLFILTTDHYPTIQILTIVICAIGGFYGVLAFLEGYKTLHDKRNWQASMVIGGITYMFAGTQLSWVLRPYLNQYEHIIRAPKGNFYVFLFEFINAHPDISTTFLLFLVLAVFCGVIYIALKRESVETVKTTPGMAVPQGVYKLEMRECPKCSSRELKESAFCTKCGTKME